jgi:hypothetical protein
MKTILTMISGPEGETLLRCVKSFAPIIDGLVVVFGSGNQDTTATENLLRDNFAKPLRIAHYKNQPDHSDWSHTDDFAAQRNLAAELAEREFSPDWICWADADDVLPKTVATIIPDILQQATAKGMDIVVTPYVLGADGRHCRRERFWRSGVRWQGRIHEHLACRDEKKTWAEQVQILHVPAIHKPQSGDRNLRILQSIPKDERTGREWFYLHEEAANRTEISLAISSGIRALDCPDLVPDEKYNIYMRLGSWLPEQDDSERSLMEAVRIDPDRREAWGVLVKRAIFEQDYARARSWNRCLTSVPAPQIKSFTHAPALYGWQARDFDWIIQAGQGKYDRAQEERRRAFKGAGRPITVIHPTCRFANAVLRREEWLSKAEKPNEIEYIFGIAEEDLEHADKHILAYPHAISAPVPAGHSTAVANHNAASRAASGKIIIVAQDDVHPPEGWDMMVRNKLKPHLNKPVVLHLHDGHREDQIMIVQCVTRPWLERAGCDILPTEYDGYFSDTEFSWRAYKAREVIDGREIRFFHNHPAFTGAACDAAYMRQQNPEAFERGLKTFRARNPDCPWFDSAPKTT